MKLELRRVTVATPGAEDARRSWPERQSLLLRLTDEDGHSGAGEASPLPGYSPDALDDVEQALQAVSAAALARALETDSALQALEAAGKLVPFGLPSARMALETAALELSSVRRETSAPLLLGAAPGATCSLAQLIGAASDASLISAATRALDTGFRALKIKLGAAGKLSEELAGLARLRAHVGPEVKLRVDANGNLDAHGVLTAWQALSHLDLELFEEPGEVPPELFGAVPLGLDESLQDLSVEQVEARLQQTRACVVVLKPMALGGLTHCLRLAESARAAGAAAVVSHCFDGPVAFRAAAALALALPAGPAHGLAPHAGLAAWRPRDLPVRDGRLEAWPEPGLGAVFEHAAP